MSDGDTLHRLAAAVAEHLNGGTYPLAVDARVRYLPSFELRELAELKVSVTPRAAIREIADRQRDALECAIDLAVMQRCDPDDEEQIAALMTLVAKLQDRVNRTRLADGAAVWIRSERDPVFLADALAEQHVFTSILTVVYRVHD